MQNRPSFCYVNGAYLRMEEAGVHVEDRGNLFSDAVYEGIALNNGNLLDVTPHLNRLQRSLDILQMDLPMSVRSIELIIYELARRNRMKNGFVYLQVSRGVARRNHAFPNPKVEPSLFIVIYPDRTPSSQEYNQGISVITRPDIRWGRRDAKTVSLLANVLAKEDGVAQGCKETWLVDDKTNLITEGSASNAFIVTDSGAIKTHPASQDILGGITREVVLNLARDNGIEVIEQPFSIDEMRQASEAFGTSTTMQVIGVTVIDNMPVGKVTLSEEKKIGPVTQKLIQLYAQHVAEQTQKSDI